MRCAYTLLMFLICCSRRIEDQTYPALRKELQSVGIQPDVLVLRTEHELSTNLKKKVALFCNVDENAVVQSIDMPTIYEVPLRMQEQGLDVTILQRWDCPWVKLQPSVHGEIF